MKRRVGVLAVFISLVCAAPAGAQTGPPLLGPPCQFVLGFKTLHDQVPVEVGNCQDNQSFTPGGDAQQHTTKGLMAWRKADNFTAFTNGSRTWINGPQGVVARLNSEHFPWEKDLAALAVPASIAAPPQLQPAIELLLKYDREHGAGYMKNLADHVVSLVVAPVSEEGAFAFFSPKANVVRVSSSIIAEDPRDIADVLAHESSHALDFYTGIDIGGPSGCYYTEITAFKHQADVWRWLYPNLKPAPTDALDDFLNDVTRSMSGGNPAAFIDDLTYAYRHQCVK